MAWFPTGRGGFKAHKADGVALTRSPMIMKRLSVRGWPSGTAADCEDTLKFAQAMGVDCKIETCAAFSPHTKQRGAGAHFCFTACRYPLEKIQDAYDSMMNNKARFRSVIVFE